MCLPLNNFDQPLELWYKYFGLLFLRHGVKHFCLVIITVNIIIILLILLENDLSGLVVSIIKERFVRE